MRDLLMREPAFDLESRMAEHDVMGRTSLRLQTSAASAQEMPDTPPNEAVDAVAHGLQDYDPTERDSFYRDYVKNHILPDDHDSTLVNHVLRGFRVMGPSCAIYSLLGSPFHDLTDSEKIMFFAGAGTLKTEEKPEGPLYKQVEDLIVRGRHVLCGLAETHDRKVRQIDLFSHNDSEQVSNLELPDADEYTTKRCAQRSIAHEFRGLVKQYKIAVKAVRETRAKPGDGPVDRFQNRYRAMEKFLSRQDTETRNYLGQKFAQEVRMHSMLKSYN